MDNSAFDERGVRFKGQDRIGHKEREMRWRARGSLARCPRGGPSGEAHSRNTKYLKLARLLYFQYSKEVRLGKRGGA